jgi:hypothetical protein
VPFTVPNEADAAFLAQAKLDKVDLDVLADAGSQGGVVSGCVVTSTAAANGSVSVAAGVIRIADRQYTVALTTVAIAANASGNPRFDLITLTATTTFGAGATITRTAGTAAASPVFPALPAGSICIAAVYVPNGHTATTTIPANTITDKRVDVSALLAASAGGNMHNFIQFPDENKAGLIIRGSNTDLGTGINFQLLEIQDWAGAPIFDVNSNGGIYVSDNIQTMYGVFGPYNFAADIYGHLWRGQQCSFAFDGPPGNMMPWVNACHEVFAGSRLGTVANWSAVAGCTLATADLGVPATGSPTGLRTAIRITNTTGSTAWVGNLGGAFAMGNLVAGERISLVTNMRFNTAAAARSATLRATFYTAAGAVVGADVDGAAVSIPNSGTGWIRVTSNNIVVPATATRVQPQILLPALTGEKHDFCGFGVMRGQTVGVFAPPFVAQTLVTGGPSVTEAGAVAGDRWVRTDTPTIPGQRDYVCTTGGLPGDQKWSGIDASSLYRLVTDVTNSTVTMASLTDFAVPVAAATAYMLDYTIMFASAATTTGIQIGVTGPASPTSVLIVAETQITTTTWQTATATAYGNLTASTGVSTITVPNLCRVKIVLLNGVNAGTVQIQFASEVAASAITVKAGSLLQVA